MAKTILITGDTLGSADPELGRILMRSFLVSLAHEERAPAAVMLVNHGVRHVPQASQPRRWTSGGHGGRHAISRQSRVWRGRHCYCGLRLRRA